MEVLDGLGLGWTTELCSFIYFLGILMSLFDIDS